MEMYEIQWKSSEDKKAVLSTHAPKSMKSKTIYEQFENLWKSCKSIEINEHLQNTMRVFEDKKPAWIRAKVSIKAAGRSLPSSAPMLRNPGKHTQNMNIMNIYKNHAMNLWKSTEIFENYKNLWNTMKSLKEQETNLESSKGF